MQHDLDKKTVAELITGKIPKFQPEAQVGRVLEILTENANQFDEVEYVVVVDKQDRFVGMVDIKQVMSAKKATEIQGLIRKRNQVWAHLHNHPETVAYLAIKNDVEAVPIVDKENKFLGVISAEVIHSILYHELRHDMLQLAGVRHQRRNIDNVLDISICRSLLHRSPWLLIGLVGGLFTARVIGFFESTLEKNLILASFIPLIVYMSDAVGTQMEAFVIRDLAIDPKLNFMKYFVKQFRVVLIMGVAFAGLLFLLSVGLYRELRIAIVLALALGGAILSSVITGMVVPYIFGKLKLDPANASGPIATIIQDLISVVIYFSIAQALLL